MLSLFDEIQGKDFPPWNGPKICCISSVLGLFSCDFWSEMASLKFGINQKKYKEKKRLR